MKEFSGKTEQEAVQKACSEFGVAESNLYYHVVSETKSLFSKKVVINAYVIESVKDFLVEYLQTLFTNMEMDNDVVGRVEGEVIHVDLDTSNNSILIGKGGVILKAINMVAIGAASNNFKKRFEIHIDINGYKEARYKKVKLLAIRVGRSVQKSRVDAKLDPMSGDERKVVHNALTNMNYVRTESSGEGRNRFVTIVYDSTKKKEVLEEINEED